ncbi:MAG: mechanosensitive ion channel family protein [Epsilonproteobacteria bacterium]|nr:mechanosensitive ion channel family protein [Campylobacterota bacterium]
MQESNAFQDLIESFPLLTSIDPIALKFGIILFSIAIIYFIRRVGFDMIELGLLRISSLEHYVKDIIARLRKPSEIVTIIINFDIVLYVYNDFYTAQHIRDIFNIVYVVVGTYWVYLFINSIIEVKLEHIESAKNVKNEVVNLGLKILNFAIVLVGLLILLNLLGVDLTAILSGLGIGGIAVALAAKDSLANFFATVSILISDTFSQGDWIQIGASEGTVVEIGLRVTTIRTFDNAMISIPNATLANGDVKNWNKRAIGRRIKMSIGVKYDSKAENIKKAVEAIRGMLQEHPMIATSMTEYEFEEAKKLVTQDDVYGVKKTLLVYLDEFGPSSINILVYCFSKSVVWSEWLETKEDVMYRIMNILQENHLEFAFPSLSLYHENKNS